MVKTLFGLVLAIMVEGCAAIGGDSDGPADSDPNGRQPIDEDAGTDESADDGAAASDDPAGQTIILQAIHVGLDDPVDMQAPTDGNGRLFIVERPGRIRISQNGILQSRADAFLDITAQVESDGGEQGLLGLAFHPEFADNGRFFVNYTRSGGLTDETVIQEFTVTGDPNRADATSGVILLQVEQPFANHNGGQLQFGPDGMLYIGLGDGGSACDPGGRAQDTGSLLGKMLRLDVDRPPSFVPVDNPFVDDDRGHDLIWAVGLRNPWRFSFDPLTGGLYIADVGQGDREEINVVSVDPTDTPNFGWPAFEGSLTPPPACSGASPTPAETVMPLFEYGHDEGCSITGGYVYRGSEIPELDGLYLYSDFCEPVIRALRFEAGNVVTADNVTAAIDQRGGTLDSPTSFGVDADGELYVLDHDGDVFRFLAVE